MSHNETFLDELFAIFVALALLAIWLRAVKRGRPGGNQGDPTSFVRADFPSCGQKKRVCDLPTLPGGSHTEFFEVPEIVWDIERAPVSADAQSQRETNQ